MNLTALASPGTPVSRTPVSRTPTLAITKSSKIEFARMTELRKTKLVCTLGPATAEVDEIRGLIEAGADVIRLNFSHAEPMPGTRKRSRTSVLWPLK